MIVKLFVSLVFTLFVANAQDNVETTKTVFEENLIKLKEAEENIKTAAMSQHKIQFRSSCKFPNNLLRRKSSKLLKKNDDDDTINQYLELMKENHSFRQIESVIMKYR